MAPSRDKWVKRFVISETSRHKRGFTIYKVTSLMFLKSAPDVISKVSIWKRYSDFKKLHSSIQSLHSSLKIKEPMPPFLKPTFFRRFETEVIEQRKECATKLLEFIGRYDALFTSDIFTNFFDSNILDQKSLESSHQSLSSDTSEEDKVINADKNDSGIACATDLPKFVCTTKVMPVKINQQNDSVKTKFVNSQSDNSDITEHEHFSHSSNKVHLSSSVVDGIEALSLQGKSTSTDAVVIHNGSDLMQSFGDSAQYILIAAAHMSAAFRHEAIAEYEEAFTQYKLGISHLIHGIQNEEDLSKKMLIQEKITKYLLRAERLYNRHLNCNVSILNKPVSELKNYKVVQVMGSVMLVKDTLQGFQRIIKTVQKVDGCKKEINSYILRGKVPYMVQLYACIQTDSTVFLVLQYMSKGKLWNFIRNNYKPNNGENLHLNKNSRSFSCEAVMQIDSIEKSNTLENLPQLHATNKLGNTSVIKEDNTSCFLKEQPAVDTNKLLENAQKLLQSVNATLKRSNSIATRLNESESLMYKQNSPNGADNSISDQGSALKSSLLSIEDFEDINDRENFNELSTSGSCSDFYANTCKIPNSISIKPNNSIVNIAKVEQSQSKQNSHKNINNFQNQLKKLENPSLETEKPMWSIPESVVQMWSAQILLALEALHQQDVVVSDLKPDDVLLDDNRNVCLAYIVPRKDTELLRLKTPYSAPELCMFIPPISITTSADVWSFGVLLYELLTGSDFEDKHPGQFYTHSIVMIPDNLSLNAKSLLLQILKFQASERPTIPEIKQHAFYANIDWLELLNVQS
ncbi:ribosomal protein S6 kinase delta-1 [Trichogramma pretiosum]|uniref:ribosomal protein S6 kinase delta-1 n=1 Tax=Trichogramma pretiosum TaxID=7493 RepID=UPI0006C9DCB7|nr:ribosomal protein S6 kinase delta-1 [Trichogramma pretiosum]